MKNAKKHPLYGTWAGMKNRCLNPNNPNYINYGGRGIQVAQEWVDDFDMFVYHMGNKPSPEHSLDRVDNDYHYCPENVRWATPSQQAYNRRKQTRKNVKNAKGAYRTTGGKYMATIMLGTKVVCLGTYNTEEQATAKYQEVKQAFFGHLSNH